MLDMIGGGMSLFLIIIITFYAGEMVWRERSMRLAEATDAYAAPDWVPRAAKMTALSGVFALVLVACPLFTICSHLVDGYTNIEPQIGRWACGERVWQDGEISVVPGRLK